MSGFSDWWIEIEKRTKFFHFVKPVLNYQEGLLYKEVLYIIKHQLIGCWSHRAIDMRAYRQSLVRIKLHHWSIRWLLELWFVDKDANNLCAFMFDGSKHRKKTSKLKLIHWPTLWLIIFQVVNPLSSMKKVIFKRVVSIHMIGLLTLHLHRDWLHRPCVHFL